MICGKKYSGTGKLVFPIFLFFDEWQTGNPLGSHVGEEKFGGVYVSLACLPPHLVAKLQKVFVYTIFHSKYLKKFGTEKLFLKTIEDLNFLSTEGITLQVDGQNQKIYFECVLILGDNLGLNSICGFSESFVQNCCRICSATFTQCQHMTVEDGNLIRTIQSYNDDLSKGSSL